MTHIWVSKLIIIGSDNGLSPDRRQTIIRTNAGILLIGPLGTNFSEILIEILTFSFKKMRLTVSSAKRRPFCVGLKVLTRYGLVTLYRDLDLSQHQFRLWLDAWRHPAITWTNVDFKLVRLVLWHALESNFTASAQATLLYDEFENHNSLKLLRLVAGRQWL